MKGICRDVERRRSTISFHVFQLVTEQVSQVHICVWVLKGKRCKCVRQCRLQASGCHRISVKTKKK